jgi:hypothetical protein
MKALKGTALYCGIDGFEIFSLFESGDCSGDSVHPNDMGATVIAQNIIKLIKERNLLK